MAKKKAALGRGLGALIDDSKYEPNVSAVHRAIDEVELDKIEINPFQPRTEFDKEALSELADSIKELGVIQPITVRKQDGDVYQLISGERRLRAAKLAGLTKIVAYVREADDQAMLEMALVENIQRQDLNAIEIAISYQRLIDECGLTQENLSGRVGKKRTTITNYLRLLKLPAEIQIGIRDRDISMGHARALVNVADEALQTRLYKKIVAEELSVRKVEELVRNANKEQKEEAKTDGETKQNVVPLQENLNQLFNAKVEVKRNNKGKGRIVIPFASDEDLERIVVLFDKWKAQES